MSSYSSTSLSSYDPASSSSDLPSSPSTSPGSSPPSPLSIKKTPSFLSGPLRSHIGTVPPLQHNRALTLDARPHGLGVDPASLVGKQLTRVRRSRTHPCITLQLSDGTVFQVLVVGYDPHYRGVPKVLESDSHILNPRSSHGVADLRLTISHAASITLSDKAFQVRAGLTSGEEKGTNTREDRWTQRHAAFALKFEEEQGWHCVWATMAEYDEKDRERCVFRNYADVYLDRLHASSNTHRPPTPSSAPAHTTTNARAASPASPSLPGSTSSSQKTQGRYKGKRKNHRKKKAGPSHGNSPPNSGAQKARW